MRLDEGRESSNVEDRRDQAYLSAGRGVSPDSFTHGSAEQRVRWFRKGIESGEMKHCDTFAARQL